MKKSLFALAFIALATVASGATITINCSQITGVVPPSVGNGISNCPGFGSIPVGNTVTQVQLNYALDFQYNLFATGTPSVTYAIDAPGTGLDVSGLIVNLGNRALAGSVILPGATAASGLTGPFTITGSWNANDPPVTATQMDFQLIVTYFPDNVVPEPMTMSMMGAGLLGLGILGRRRMAKR